MSEKMSILKENIIQLLADHPGVKFSTSQISERIYGQSNASTCARISNALTAHHWWKEIGIHRTMEKHRGRQRWAYWHSQGEISNGKIG